MAASLVIFDDCDNKSAQLKLRPFASNSEFMRNFDNFCYKCLKTDVFFAFPVPVNKFLDSANPGYSYKLVHAGVPVNWVPASSPTDSLRSYILPGETALMSCARLGLESAALFLLEQHSVSPVDVSVHLDSGETVFHLAVEAKLRDLCKCLITKHDVDPNQFRSVLLSSNPVRPQWNLTRRRCE